VSQEQASSISLYLHIINRRRNAVSRTCTAPFDRLKIFLITRPPELGGAVVAGGSVKPSGGIKIIANAVARIYSEGGVLAFWTGNGLSVAKIFPESAIKFFAYESSVSILLFHPSYITTCLIHHFYFIAVSSLLETGICAIL